MKNFFGKKMQKGNPFMANENDKGEKNKMDEEIKEEIQETVNNEITDDNESEGESVNESCSNNNEESSSEIKEEPAEEKDENTKLKEEFDNLNNQYIRLAADFDNYRKRQAQEREALLKYGAEECMKKVLEVVDNFDRAITMVEKTEDLEKMKEMFFVLNKQLNESLKKLGLEQIKCVGETFDPNLHEAVMQTQTEEYPEDTVIREMQKGYKLGEKVLRPAMVSVAVK